MSNIQPMRALISSLMRQLPVPDDPSDVVRIREDGTQEFTRHWCVRGTPTNGLFASYKDWDDVIEYGLLERCDGTTTNILHVTVLCDDDEVANVNCLSETNDELNFDITLPKGQELDENLDKAFSYFAMNLGGQGD